MGSVRWPSDCGSGVTKCVELIQCVDGWGPQIHENWCLSADGVTHKINPKVSLEVSAVTVGQFTTNYFA